MFWFLQFGTSSKLERFLWSSINFHPLYFGWELQLRGNLCQGPFSKDALLENGTKSHNFKNLFFVTSHFGTLLQVFANGKRHFHSFTEFYVMHLKKQGVKCDYSGTLSAILGCVPLGQSKFGSVIQDLSGSVWIMVHQRTRRIHSGHGFAGSFDAP